MNRWDVIVVGGGPAGLSAAHAAARAGARTLVLEKAEHPRYKTCGGGLIGASVAALPADLAVPVREQIDRATFTLDGARSFTRAAADRPLVAMVDRSEFDAALADAAGAAGAEIRCRATVRGLAEDEDGDGVHVTLAGGERLTAGCVVGADGSSGITSRYVGVSYDQVDLGLELELPVDERRYGPWRGRLLIDWGPMPGSYGWVFPKHDRLTVGVIATRGQGEATRAYLRDFVDRLGLSDLDRRARLGPPDPVPVRRRRRCAGAGCWSPVTRPGCWSRGPGRGSATRLRSGALAGAAACTEPARYEADVERVLGPSMRAGRRLLAAYARHPAMFHRVLRTGPGWRLFARFARGELAFDTIVDRRPVRAALALIS